MGASTSHNRPAHLDRVSIDHERWVSIRPIERTDAAGLSDFYARLSPESRRRRFLSCGDAPVANVGRLADSPGLVGVMREAGPNDGAIVAHASIHPDVHGSAEVAFAVADELQGLGVGRSLVAMTLKRARRLGAAQVTATMLADNASMRHLLRTTGAPILFDRLAAGTEDLALVLSGAPVRRSIAA